MEAKKGWSDRKVSVEERLEMNPAGRWGNQEASWVTNRDEGLRAHRGHKLGEEAHGSSAATPSGQDPHKGSGTQLLS